MIQNKMIILIYENSQYHNYHMYIYLYCKTNIYLNIDTNIDIYKYIYI